MHQSKALNKSNSFKVQSKRSNGKENNISISPAHIMYTQPTHPPTQHPPTHPQSRLLKMCIRHKIGAITLKAGQFWFKQSLFIVYQNTLISDNMMFTIHLRSMSREFCCDLSFFSCQSIESSAPNLQSCIHFESTTRRANAQITCIQVQVCKNHVKSLKYTPVTQSILCLTFLMCLATMLKTQTNTIKLQWTRT